MESRALMSVELHAQTVLAPAHPGPDGGHHVRTQTAGRTRGPHPGIFRRTAAVDDALALRVRQVCPAGPAAGSAARGPSLAAGGARHQDATRPGGYGLARHSGI